MFRSISSHVGHRQKTIVVQEATKTVLYVVIRTFLSEYISEKAAQVKFEASIQKGVLNISVPQKSLANEIVFQAKSLQALLKKNNIVCTRLVVH